MYKNGEFSLTTPKVDEKEEVPLVDLFPKSKFVSLYEVLATVNTATGFLDAFTHWQTTHIGSKPSAKTFYAGIMGLGSALSTCALGLLNCYLI